MKPAHPTLPGIPAPPPKPRPERPVTAMDWCRAEAVDFGEVLDVLTRMGQESPLRRVYLGAVAALGLLRRPAKGEPIPLLAADTGEVMALACPTCRNVRVAGYVCGGYRPNDPRRHLDSVADCCRCACGAVTGPLQRECAACAAKEAPAREAAAAVEEERAESEAQTFAAMLRERLATWDPARPYPLAIVRPSGTPYLAFPLPWREIPSDLEDGTDGLRWWLDNQAAPYGCGETPEAALADLRARAAAIRDEEEQRQKAEGAVT